MEDTPPTRQLPKPTRRSRRDDPVCLGRQPFPISAVVLVLLGLA
jgi:hypothetical protein